MISAAAFGGLWVRQPREDDMHIAIPGALIKTLGNLLPGGATKASAKLGGTAVGLATISALIDPVNELGAALQALALGISAVAGAIAGLLAVFGVGRKAGATVVEVNVEPSELTAGVDIFLQGAAGQVVPRIVAEIEGGRGAGPS